METTIHNVIKIKFDSITERETDEGHKYAYRDIVIESSDEGELKIACFGKTKKDLEIEIEIKETKNI